MQRFSLRNYIPQPWQLRGGEASGGKRGDVATRWRTRCRDSHLRSPSPLGAENVDGACCVHAVRQTRPLTRVYEHGGVASTGPVHTTTPLCVLACLVARDVVPGVAARGRVSRIVDTDASCATCPATRHPMFAPFALAFAVSREGAHTGGE